MKLDFMNTGGLPCRCLLIFIQIENTQRYWDLCWGMLWGITALKQIYINDIAHIFMYDYIH